MNLETAADLLEQRRAIAAEADTYEPESLDYPWATNEEWFDDIGRRISALDGSEPREILLASRDEAFTDKELSVSLSYIRQQVDGTSDDEDQVLQVSWRECSTGSGPPLNFDPLAVFTISRSELDDERANFTLAKIEESLREVENVDQKTRDARSPYETGMRIPRFELHPHDTSNGTWTDMLVDMNPTSVRGQLVLGSLELSKDYGLEQVEWDNFPLSILRLSGGKPFVDVELLQNERFIELLTASERNDIEAFLGFFDDALDADAPNVEIIPSQSAKATPHHWGRLAAAAATAGAAVVGTLGAVIYRKKH